MARILAKTNPKGEDIAVSDDGNGYANQHLSLRFQSGVIPQYGTRNGAFEEEVLAVLIDRAEAAGNTALQTKLTEALEILVPATT